MLFEKQTKTIEDQREKQIKAIQDKRSIKSIEKFNYDINDSPLVLKEREIYNKLTEESFEKINNLDKKVNNRLVFKYKGNTADEDFSGFDNAFELISKIRGGEVSLNEAKDEQAKLKLKIGEIKKVAKKRLLKESREARTNVENFYNARKATIDFFDEFTSRASEARRQAKKGIGLEILTPNQMLKRLPIALAQIKAGNNSEILLNEIRQIVYSLCRSKEITKKVYKHIIKSIKVKYKMDTIFMNSENSRTSEYHALVLKVTDKLDLRRGQKTLALSNLSIYYTWKNIKSSYNN